MNEPTQAAMGAASKKPWARRAVIIVLALAFAIGTVVWLAAAGDLAGEDAWYDGQARSGSVAGMTEEEIERDLGEKVEEGMMNISISSVLSFPDGSSAPGTARIENSEANTLDQKVAITLDGTNETVYESDAIAPGSSIDQVDLSSALAKGTYDATATITGYDRTKHERIGSIGVQVKIVVEK